MKEEWREISGWEGLYEVSNQGKIRSLARVVTKSNGVKQPVKARILRPAQNADGYLYCALSRNGELITVMLIRLTHTNAEGY